MQQSNIDTHVSYRNSISATQHTPYTSKFNCYSHCNALASVRPMNQLPSIPQTMDSTCSHRYTSRQHLPLWRFYVSLFTYIALNLNHCHAQCLPAFLNKPQLFAAAFTLTRTLTQLDQQWSLQPCNARAYTLIVSAATKNSIHSSAKHPMGYLPTLVANLIRI